MSSDSMARGSWGELAATLFALAAAAASGALLLAIADDGYSTFETLILWVGIPSIGLLAFLYGLARWRRWEWLSRALILGLWTGAVSTIGLEIIRIIGFRVFHSMPGDLPTLMGVLLTGRIMQGPDTLSTILGYADHFWNGASFGSIYAVVFGRRSWWVAWVYAVVFMATGFLASPVPNAMGAGYFGVLFGPQFAITVYLAHTAYGVMLGWLTWRAAGIGQSTIFQRFWPVRKRLELSTPASPGSRPPRCLRARSAGLCPPGKPRPHEGTRCLLVLRRIVLMDRVIPRGDRGGLMVI